VIIGHQRAQEMTIRCQFSTRQQPEQSNHLVGKRKTHVDLIFKANCASKGQILRVLDEKTMTLY
jgi:hypothetical protein